MDVALWFNYKLRGPFMSLDRFRFLEKGKYLSFNIPVKWSVSTASTWWVERQVSAHLGRYFACKLGPSSFLCMGCCCFLVLFVLNLWFLCIAINQENLLTHLFISQLQCSKCNKRTRLRDFHYVLSFHKVEHLPEILSIQHLYMLTYIISYPFSFDFKASCWT